MASNDTERAWGREVELVVYDPKDVSSAAILEQGGATFGLVLSDLHVEFSVTRSQVYAENTAEFKVYNAKPSTRQQMASPGQRIRFSAGYKDQGGPIGIFWGSIMRGPSSRKGASWETNLTCISSLTESTGSEDIATWDKKNPKASREKKLEVITRAVNRIPVQLSFGAGSRVKEAIRTMSAITGLVLWGLEGMPELLFPNGFVYVGGARGAMMQLDKMLRRNGWALNIDNMSLLVLPLVGGNLTATVAYLTKDTGLLDLRETTDLNVPPKLDKNGKRVHIPKSYEFKCLLNPKIAPNTLVEFNTEQAKITALVTSVTVSGNNFGGEFQTSGKCVVWSGIGDTWKKAP